MVLPDNHEPPQGRTPFVDMGQPFREKQEKGQSISERNGRIPESMTARNDEQPFFA